MTIRATFLALAAALALAATLAARPALATDAAPTEKDPVAQARAVKLSETLRCLVCQNQTIADSNAELAVDLRRQVREQIAAGRTDDEIIKYMTDRYGDFVLYRPPVRATTVLLWAGPLLLLILGAFVLLRIMRERRAAPEAPPLSADERARAEALLAPPTRKDSA
jgi:cytochrome c-type biogenesis protein CcmH